MSVKEMIQRELENLPENLALEVYDFILFLESKNENKTVQKSAQSLSESCFNKIWDNQEDAIYDEL